MILAEVTLRYAKALFNLSSSDEQLEKRLNALNQFLEGLIQSPQTRLFLTSPHTPLKDKEEVLKSILKESADQDIASFLTLLLKERRFNYLKEIIEKYDQLVKEKLQIFEGQLITAIPLSSSAREKLVESLEKKYKKKIELKELVDPRVIGGAILTINNQRMDFSVKGKLERLELTLRTESAISTEPKPRD